MRSSLRGQFNFSYIVQKPYPYPCVCMCTMLFYIFLPKLIVDDNLPKWKHPQQTETLINNYNKFVRHNLYSNLVTKPLRKYTCHVSVFSIE